MSVTTEADRIVDQMRHDVQKALKSTNNAFNELVVNNCWGAQEFSDEFKIKLAAAQKTLLELRTELGEPRLLSNDD